MSRIGLPTSLPSLIADLQRRVGAVERRAVLLPVLPSDPSSPAEGQVWVNQTTNALSVHYGGATRRVTLT